VLVNIIPKVTKRCVVLVNIYSKSHEAVLKSSVGQYYSKSHEAVRYLTGHERFLSQVLVNIYFKSHEAVRYLTNLTYGSS
jgi:hypothetical protein